MCPRVEGVYGHLYYVIIVYQHQDTADETESFIPVLITGPKSVDPWSLIRAYFLSVPKQRVFT